MTSPRCVLCSLLQDKRLIVAGRERRWLPRRKVRASRWLFVSRLQGLDSGPDCDDPFQQCPPDVSSTFLPIYQNDH